MNRIKIKKTGQVDLYKEGYIDGKKAGKEEALLYQVNEVNHIKESMTDLKIDKHELELIQKNLENSLNTYKNKYQRLYDKYRSLTTQEDRDSYERERGFEDGIPL